MPRSRQSAVRFSKSGEVHSCRARITSSTRWPQSKSATPSTPVVTAGPTSESEELEWEDRCWGARNTNHTTHGQHQWRHNSRQTPTATKSVQRENQREKSPDNPGGRKEGQQSRGGEHFAPAPLRSVAQQ